MAIANPFPLRAASIFWLFVAWLALIFLTGGSGRGDVVQLLILRPAAVLVCALLLATTSWSLLRSQRVLLALIGAAIGLTLLHLVPLPPSIWQALPQRELIAEIDRAVGLGEVWRPLTIAPAATWNALYALAVPLSVALFMARIEPDRWPTLVPVLLGLGLACMILGILQTTAASSDSPLYPYRVSNFGAPIGLFANRNHTGAFMAAMLPWLAVFASYRGERDESYRLRLWLAGGGAAIVLLFLLLLGSRAGLLLGFFGLVSMPIVYDGAATRMRGARPRIIAIMGAIVLSTAIAAIAVLASRAKSLQRLLGVEEGENYRITTFFPILRLANDYLPLGSGIGTFVETYQRHEPLDRLEPRYFNHAHNDLLEVFLTGGIPAMILLAVFAWVAARAAVPLFRRSSAKDLKGGVKKAAAVTLCLFALASIVDYPLRTPALSSFAAIMFAMILARTDREGTGAKRETAAAQMYRTDRMEMDAN